ncbi:MAG: hypothetical protein A2Z97_02320 [Bdellovibrionales bacterium GWB1_52_6]|nr:MAG: hypothetical protein A2Z97_02320 [Bdellovibrionales bacterium GWB1_52_6]OFZ04458.1 MAG: hypothetical protein A2X97_07390 [Bdellovibrionales bacterium GWA1_52_35]HCM40680.1 NADH-quinone oxidoreductase subunit J [Bdellovibrionales bacterium]
MEINPAFFYIFAGLAIAFSLLVVIKKSAIASAFNLVCVFFSFAGIYAMMDAHLIAAIQIIVYAGAVMVLFLFVIMLLNADNAAFDMHPIGRGKRLVSASFVVVMAGMFIWVFKNTTYLGPISNFSNANVEAAGGNTQVLSELMFSEYILPFELTSVLLLAAIIGTIAIAKRKKPAALLNGGSAAKGGNAQ